MVGYVGAWRGVVGGAWEWEGLYEWEGIWGRGLELWAGPGSGRGLGMDKKWGSGLQLWAGPGRGFLNGWEFGGVAWSCGRGLIVGGAI